MGIHRAAPAAVDASQRSPPRPWFLDIISGFAVVRNRSGDSGSSKATMMTDAARDAAQVECMVYSAVHMAVSAEEDSARRRAALSRVALLICMQVNARLLHFQCVGHGSCSDGHRVSNALLV